MGVGKGETAHTRRREDRREGESLGLKYQHRAHRGAEHTEEKKEKRSKEQNQKMHSHPHLNSLCLPSACSVCSVPTPFHNWLDFASVFAPSRVGGFPTPPARSFPRAAREGTVARRAACLARGSTDVTTTRTS